MNPYEIINSVFGCLIIPSLTFCFLFTGIYFYKKEKIYRYTTTDWLEIKKYPIPKDIRGFIATDGKKVEHIHSITWGPYGEVIFNKYDETYLTHWMPLPDVPKKE